MCWIGHRFSAPGAAVCVATAASLCVAMLEAKPRNLPANGPFPPSAHGGAPDEELGYDSGAFLSVSENAPGMGRSDPVIQDRFASGNLPATREGYAVAGTRSPSRNHMLGVPPQIDGPDPAMYEAERRTSPTVVNAGNTVAIPMQRARRRLATTDAFAGSPDSLASPRGSEMMSSIGPGGQTSATQAVAPTAYAAAPGSAAFSPLVSNAPNSLLAPPVSRDVLQPSFVRSFAYPVASAPVLVGAPGVNIPSSAPYAFATGSPLSMLQSAAAAERTPAFQYDTDTSPAATTSLTSREASEAPRVLLSFPMGSSILSELSFDAPGFATAAPSVPPAGLVDTQALLHGRRNKQGTSDVEERRSARLSTGKGLSETDRKGSRRGGILLARETEKVQHQPANWTRGNAQTMKSRMEKKKANSRIKTNSNDGCKTFGESDSFAVSQIQTSPGRKLTDSGKPALSKVFAGNLLAAEPRKLVVQSSRRDSDDIFSNAPEPAALNYAFFRGFGNVRRKPFLGSPGQSQAVPTAGPGYELVQYTSNADLPVWGIIPNFPINFSTL